MAHFAKIENNIVSQVIVINNEVLENKDFPESESIGIAFCKSLYGSDTNWLQTSYNSNFRGIYASIGDTYDDELDAFLPPKPFNSWVINLITKLWESPVGPRPEGSWTWNESNLEWEEVTE
jgi:hypothetical protein